MYAVEVSDHIMIAHSFKGEVFGPAQALHGATFTVAVAFMSEKLDPNGIVVDIGCAIDVLKATLKVVNYKNLDEMPRVQGREHHHRMADPLGVRPFADAVKAGKLGREPREISGAPRDGRRVAERARLVRGAACGERRLRLRDPGRSRHADRRLRLRPAHDRGIARARLAAGGARPRRRLSASGRADAARPPSAHLADVPKGRPIVIDGLAFGVMPEAAASLRETHPLIALVHHPLALETGVTRTGCGGAARRASAPRSPVRAQSS